MRVCPGLPGAPPFEELSFPTVSFQRCWRPTGAAARAEAANHSAPMRLSDSAVGPSASRCALTSQRGGKRKDISLWRFFFSLDVSVTYDASYVRKMVQSITAAFKHQYHLLFDSDNVISSFQTVALTVRFLFFLFLNVIKTFCPR